MNKRILFATAECAPFAKVGGLADVASSLPRALRQEGVDIRVIMPLYKKIKIKYQKDLQFVRWTMLRLGWRTVYAGLFTMTYEGVPYYFIDNEFYFCYDEIYVEYNFDIERYVFFQRAVLECMGEAMDFYPDILHCNDWQTGLLPVLLEAHYKPASYWKNLKTVLTIHNLKYQGLYDYEKIADLCDLSHEFLNDYGVTKEGVPNFLKAGLVYSNAITTVSPSYAEEIQNPFYGEGLEYIVQNYAYKLHGILNGLGTEEFDPQKDTYLVKTFDAKTVFAHKPENKLALQKRLGLQEDVSLPLIGMVSRLVDQKGIDLILHVLQEILDIPCQVVILGTGEAKYEGALRYFEQHNPGKMVAYISYNNEVAHQIYASSDLFLMPSLFEPCGLSQLISMRYGTIPVVRETGGLKDTVQAYNYEEHTGTGFSFANINAHELLFCLQRACKLYKEEPEQWKGLMLRAMNVDSTWSKSAKEYMALYKRL